MYTHNDGGRKESGRKGNASDCVVRAVAIASGLSYDEVYARCAEGNATQRKGRAGASSGRKSANNGIHTQRKWFKDYMASLGFKWTPCMTIGSGCKVHVSADELPRGNLVLMLSRHCAAFIDGVLHDNHDSSRNGTRCVYGYWIKEVSI